MIFGKASFTGAKSYALSDTVNLDPQPAAFMVQADGTLSIEDGYGNTPAIVVKAGTIYPIAARKYRSTNTVTITAVIGLW